jgi:hypothetical protein
VSSHVREMASATGASEGSLRVATTSEAGQRRTSERTSMPRRMSSTVVPA